ncbi:hypothetical protein L6452_33881 [Arctium lappa]|uniref:Uncharacterized protein n=1 Tax=Arctium lappa TaxID=4217 RepID=A0ACB8YHT4_ARCLA|nr:hypothetical protein L6452_33881 [Arctium lappa]
MASKLGFTITSSRFFTAPIRRPSVGLSLSGSYRLAASKVLQRKTKEAAMATKRLKEFLEAHNSTRDNSVTSNTNGANGQCAALTEELAVLRQDDGFASKEW